MKKIKNCIAPVIVLILSFFVSFCSKKDMAEHFNEIASDEKSKPDRVIISLEIRDTDDIADLGAGGGYFSYRFADITRGTVYAVDVEEAYLERIRERAKKDHLENLKTVKAGENNPNLPDNSCDLIFIRNVYHHLSDRVDYFTNLKKPLKPGGRVAIVEYAGTGIWQKIFGHNTPPETIRSELEKAGYAIASEYDFLPEQSFIIFRVKREQ